MMNGMFRYDVIRMMGIRLWSDIILHDIKVIICRNVFCRYGFHKIYPSGEKYYTNSNNIFSNAVSERNV